MNPLPVSMSPRREQVARLIARTQQHHPRTSIVVTHDFETLAAIADRVYLLDSSRKELREIAPEKWNELGALMRTLSLESAENDQTEELHSKARPGWFQRVWRLRSIFYRGRDDFWNRCSRFRSDCCRSGGASTGAADFVCTICDW